LTFGFCRNLTTMPDIPDSVTNMYRTFANCTNVQGEIFIYSNEVSNFSECFYNTNASKSKTVFCFSGTNTYNLAINTINGQNGVTVEGMES